MKHYELLILSGFLRVNFVAFDKINEMMTSQPELYFAFHSLWVMKNLKTHV